MCSPNNDFETLGRDEGLNRDSWCKSYDLRPIEEIAQPYQQVFAEYPGFNIVQSKILDDALYTDNSLVVSAPTGAGKTVIFELALVRLLIAVEKGELHNLFKAVYISPMKALCEERLVDWHKKFGNLGLNCISVTGDSDNVEFQELFNHNLIITTPEKWDCLTRKWKDNKKMVQVIKLFMIDEVHLLNEEGRGPALETIVCRMKTIEESAKMEESGNLNHKIRFVAVSATLPNAEDIAEWIGKPPNVKHYKFTDEYRPVKLNKIVLGYPLGPHSSPFKFDLFLNYKLQSLIKQYSNGKPTLIFCSTRKLVEMTAKYILLNLTVTLKSEQKRRLEEVAITLTDTRIKESLVHGVGYHHAGMLPETRRAIESLFRNSELPILVTTSTLAVGVNLPAHLVIIKSTKSYSNGEFRDYSVTALLQMIGRAGRPQFDTEATALILTTEKDKAKFEKIISGLEPIESNLHKHLTEHLNAEVVLETITDLEVAMRWLSSTFLYIRAKKNPRHYRLASNSSSEQIDKKLLEMCQIELNKLIKARMLTMDQDTVLKSTPIGSLMAKFYLAFETMKLFTQMTGNEILQQILNLISQCHEFSEMYLRVNDKKCLNLLNRCRNGETIRFPLNGKIKTVAMKINCIIQAVLGCLDICDHSLLSETLKIMRNGERIVKCLIEYLESKDKCYKALLSTIILAKCFHVKLWENSPYVSKQLTGIGNVMSSHFVKAGKTSFERISECGAREIELLINKKPPMGNKILEEIYHLPKYKLRLELGDNQNVMLIVSLENFIGFQENPTVNRNSLMHLLVGDSSNNILLYEKYSHSYMMENPDVIKLIDLKEKNPECVEAHFISEDWVGIDCSATLETPQKQKPKEVQATKTANKVKPKTNKTEDVTNMQKFMEGYMQHSRKNKITVTEDIDVDEETDSFEKIGNSDTIVHSNIQINNKTAKTKQKRSNTCEKIENRDAVIVHSNIQINNKIEECHQDRRDTSEKIENRDAIIVHSNIQINNKTEKGKCTNPKINAANQVLRQPDRSDSNTDISKTNKNIIKQRFARTPKQLSEKRSFLKMTYPEKEQTNKKQKAEEHQIPDKKITWRSPITYSPPVKFSPKSPKIISSNMKETPQESETSSTSTSVVQEAAFKVSTSLRLATQTSLVKLKSSKVASFFPLTDQACVDSSADDSRNKIMEELGDVIAPSVWENVGISPLSREKVNLSRIRSPTYSSDYYNELLSQFEMKKYEKKKQQESDVMSGGSAQRTTKRQRENDFFEAHQQENFEKDKHGQRQPLEIRNRLHYSHTDQSRMSQGFNEECYDRRYLENAQQPSYVNFDQRKADNTSQRGSYSDEKPVFQRLHLERLRDNNTNRSMRLETQDIHEDYKHDNFLNQSQIFNGSEKKYSHSQPFYFDNTEFFKPREELTGRSYFAEKSAYNQRLYTDKPCTVTRANGSNFNPPELSQRGESDSFFYTSLRDVQPKESIADPIMLDDLLLPQRDTMSDSVMEIRGPSPVSSLASIEDKEENTFSQLLERHLSFEENDPFYIEQNTKIAIRERPDNSHFYGNPSRTDCSSRGQGNEEMDYSRSYRSRDEDMRSVNKIYFDNFQNCSRPILPLRREEAYNRSYGFVEERNNENHNFYEENLGRFQDFDRCNCRSYERNSRSISQRSTDTFHNRQNYVTNSIRSLPYKEPCSGSSFVTSTPKPAPKPSFRNIGNGNYLRESQSYCRRQDYPINQPAHRVDPEDKDYMMERFLDAVREEQRARFHF